MINIKEPMLSCMPPSVYVSIEPYQSIEKVFMLMQSRPTLSADFSVPSSNRSYSISQWYDIICERLRVAKVLWTYQANKSLFSDYEVVIENKFFMSPYKYKITFDRRSNVNGKMGKIIIQTGKAQDEWGDTYLAGANEIAAFIRRMYADVGFNETKKFCDSVSTLTQAR